MLHYNIGTSSRNAISLILYSHRLRPTEIENAADLFTHVIQYTLYIATHRR